MGSSEERPGGWTREQLAEQLAGLGVRPATDVVVHSSMRAVGWVSGGPETLLCALRDVLGPEATVVVPSQTTSNSTTSSAHRRRIEGMTDEQVAKYLDWLPPFVASQTPSEEMGLFAEHVRCRPGARRSAHPTSSFAALGPQAARFTESHPPDCHLGEESPLGALEKSGAQVLLAGVGFARATAFHLAEYRLPQTARRYRSKIAHAGGPAGEWIEYEGIRLDDSDFDAIGEDLRKETDLVRDGEVGAAAALCFPMPEAVRFAEEWMRTRRNARVTLPGGDGA